MTQVTLLTQTGASGTTGNTNLIGSASPVTLSFNPQINVGFSGTISIDGSVAPNPGPNDWSSLVSLNFAAQTSNVIISMYLNSPVPNIRCRLISGLAGQVAVYASY